MYSITVNLIEMSIIYKLIKILNKYVGIPNKISIIPIISLHK